MESPPIDIEATEGNPAPGRHIDLPDVPSANPCLSCGACCAFFRCSFYWREGDDATPGGGPVVLTEDISQHRRAMRGTNQRQPHCVALAGVVGVSAGCSIYDRRPTTCRIFVPSWFNGEPNVDCDRARAAHGLPPLTPDAWRNSPGREDTPRRRGPRRRRAA